MSQMTSSSATRPAVPCARHDSMRQDGLLDNHCMRCGADGYWHDGHRHDVTHPSGKIMFQIEHGTAREDEELGWCEFCGVLEGDPCNCDAAQP